MAEINPALTEETEGPFLLQDDKATLAPWAVEAPLAESPAVKLRFDTLNAFDSAGYDSEHDGRKEVGAGVVDRRIVYYCIACVLQFCHFSTAYLGSLFASIHDKGVIDAIMLLAGAIYVLLPWLILASPVGFRYTEEPDPELTHIPADVHLTNMRACIFVNSLDVIYLSLTLLYADIPFFPGDPSPRVFYALAIAFGLASAFACMKIVRITREAATADELEQKSGHRISIWNPWNAKIIIVNLIPSYA